MQNNFGVPRRFCFSGYEIAVLTLDSVARHRHSSAPSKIRQSHLLLYRSNAAAELVGPDSHLGTASIVKLNRINESLYRSVVHIRHCQLNIT